ncbi:MAG: hypothetical protein CVV44_01055 [Spirochaetae bacterium HGW-Spirochaetae-1]|jgi:hypothetical protein|nr:MAG: hypothetical protein CVV44_01055 [Spirochaetae bacterium HGW-Spirochaetae-1]
MKKTYVSILAALLLMLSTPVFAVDYIVGARAGYFMWDSWLQDVASQFNDMGTGSGALYGPVASVLFTDDISLSVSGLFGSQNTHGMSENIPQSATENKTLIFTFDTFRMDIDSALSYRIMDNLKIFAGYKFWYLKTEYNGMDYRYNTTFNTLTEANQETLKLTQPFHGPALGLGFSLPLGSRGFFVSANLSAIYMMGKMKMDGDPRNNIDNLGALTQQPSINDTFDMQMYGFNIEPTIGLNIGEGMPIVTLGVRYQINRFEITENTGGNLNEDWMTDQIYGVFVGVLYKI